MVKIILSAVTATVLLASSAAPSSARVIAAAMDTEEDGTAEVGTGETEPPLVSVLGLGSLAGLWRLLPTMQHPITEHPVMATALLQPYRPLGTGVTHTSNITHMCQTARLHGGK